MNVTVNGKTWRVETELEMLYLIQDVLDWHVQKWAEIKKRLR